VESLAAYQFRGLFSGTSMRVGRYLFSRKDPALALKKGETIMAINSATSVDKRETAGLIGSDKVEGTPVYRSNGEKAGRIERVMLDKISGKVAYAVMSFGGFMGIGEDYYPLPWSVLTYNPRLEGYEVNITEQQLKGAPKYGKHESWDWSDRARGQKVYDYYGVTPYWS
jgi:PRC-barrel domain